uniref:Diphthine--ammonia ligase n=1 Tax=Romanomermis culicivorax TaxID=13658 RepID=A0A915L678_ROMCU
MKVVALISGGKDSCYNLMKCVENRHEIVCLANLHPPAGIHELDSYMYQTVGHDALHVYADAMGLPLHRREIVGKPVMTDMSYNHKEPKIEQENKEYDEVEDLYILLKEVVQLYDVEAVSVGAIFSDYQRVRVENVCSRLNLKMLAYLWHCDQKHLLDEMIESGLEAIIIKVAAMGLDPKTDLGKNLSQIRPKLLELEKRFGINVCGEGGEFETFVLDCPLFEKRIKIDKYDISIHSDDAFAPVGFLKLTKIHLEDK